jgi:hypothetical protein
MDQPILRPAPAFPEERVADPPEGAMAIRASAYPQPKRRPRPGWKATIVRAESFARLRAIQKSTTDPVVDLSYLADACLQMALDIGPEAIVQRALSGLRPNRTKP